MTNDLNIVVTDFCICNYQIMYAVNTPFSNIQKTKNTFVTICTFVCTKRDQQAMKSSLKGVIHFADWETLSFFTEYAIIKNTYTFINYFSLV